MVNEIVCIQLQSIHLYDFSKAVLQGGSEKKIIRGLHSSSIWFFEGQNTRYEKKKFQRTKRLERQA